MVFILNSEKKSNSSFSHKTPNKAKQDRSEDRNETSTNPQTDTKKNRRTNIDPEDEILPYGQNKFNIVNNSSPFEIAKRQILGKISNSDVKGSNEIKEYLATIVKAEQEIEAGKVELAHNKSMNLSEVFNSYFNIQGNDYLLIEDIKAGLNNLSFKKEYLKQDNIVAIMRRYSSLKRFEDSKNKSSDMLLYAMTFNEFLNMLTPFDPKYREMVINRTPHANKAKENLIKLNQKKKSKNMRSDSLATDLEIDLFKYFEKLIKNLALVNSKWAELKKSAKKNNIDLPQAFRQLFETDHSSKEKLIPISEISTMIEDDVVFKRKKTANETKLPVKNCLELFINYQDYEDLSVKDQIPVDFLIDALDLD